LVETGLQFSNNIAITPDISELKFRNPNDVFGQRRIDMNKKTAVANCPPKVMI